MDPTAIDLSLIEDNRIVGVTHHGNHRLDVPVISHIIDNLYMGGFVEGVVLPPEIDHVVSLYPWGRYRSGRILDSYLAFQMFDDTEQDGLQFHVQVDRLGWWAANSMGWGPTLVHCQAGVNRSGLVAARALHLVHGMSGEDAIDLLREKRDPAVLCNPTFESMVLSWGA